MPLAIPFLSTGPKVLAEGTRLTAWTSPVFAVLTLGLCLKHFEADASRGELVFSRRTLWLFNQTWRFPFHDVREILYRYDNLSPFDSMSAQNSTDCFKILLELHDGREITLFRWIGEGEFGNNTFRPDFMYWEQFLVDFTGTQKDESLMFFEVLKRMIFPRGMLDPGFTGRQHGPSPSSGRAPIDPYENAPGVPPPLGPGEGSVPSRRPRPKVHPAPHKP